MSGGYSHFYASDPAAENPFGSEALAERDSRALISHCRAGGSPLTFNKQPSEKERADWRALSRAFTRENFT